MRDLASELILLVSMLAGANAFATEVVDCGTTKPDGIEGAMLLNRRTASCGPCLGPQA